MVPIGEVSQAARSDRAQNSTPLDPDTTMNRAITRTKRMGYAVAFDPLGVAN